VALRWTIGMNQYQLGLKPRCGCGPFPGWGFGRGRARQLTLPVSVAPLSPPLAHP
jgi:hypothetical protein